MKILISNDDGVFAPGIDVLAKALSKLATVTVVAPDRDRSAASNSLTLDMPLRITKQMNGYYSVNGTPTDAVHLAITGWMDEAPDMVVSGINSGANLGDDVIYSGTVAAAMEGRYFGFPAIAVSLVSPDKKFRYYDTAARIVCTLIETLKRDPLPKDTILNVNVPDKPLSDIKGIKVARLGNRHLAEPVITAKDPRNETIYWIGPAGKEQDAGPGTDFHAINEGYVSITPIKIDLSDYQAIKHISEWAETISITE